MLTGSKRFHVLNVILHMMYNAIPLMSKRTEMPISIFLGKAFSSIRAPKCGQPINRLGLTDLAWYKFQSAESPLSLSCGSTINAPLGK